MAAYPLVFLLAPLVNADLLLTADILQAVTVVRNPAVAMVGDEVAGKVRAVGTTVDPGLTGGALGYLTTLKRYVGASFMQAAFAGDLVYGYVQLLTESLQDSRRVLSFRIVPDAVHGAGATIYSADGSEMCTFQGMFTFLRTYVLSAD
jgi:hypothetical protein